jgi:hypothetical protein
MASEVPVIFPIISVIPFSFARRASCNPSVRPPVLCADESFLDSSELEQVTERYQMVNIKLDKTKRGERADGQLGSRIQRRKASRLAGGPDAD